MAGARLIEPLALDVATVAAGRTVVKYRGTPTKVRATGTAAGHIFALDDPAYAFPGQAVEIENASAEPVGVETDGGSLLLHLNCDQPYVSGVAGSEVVADASGNGNNATNVGATYAAAGGPWSGGAFQYNGVANHLRAPAQSHPTEHLTLAGWLYCTGAGTTTARYFASRSVATGTNHAFGLYFQYETHTAAAVVGNTSFVWSSTYNLPVNTWTFLAYTYDRSLSSARAKLYVNGVLYATANPNYDMRLAAAPFYVGCRGDGVGTTLYHFQGDITDVRVYDTALTAAEIQQLYRKRPLAATENALLVCTGTVPGRGAWAEVNSGL